MRKHRIPRFAGLVLSAVLMPVALLEAGITFWLAVILLTIGCPGLSALYFGWHPMSVLVGGIFTALVVSTVFAVVMGSRAGTDADDVARGLGAFAYMILPALSATLVASVALSFRGRDARGTAR